MPAPPNRAAVTAPAGPGGSRLGRLRRGRSAGFMPSEVFGLRTHAAADATASRRHRSTGQPSCRPRMTPAAKASPAPVVLRTCSRGTRTEPCRQVRPPGAAATQPAGKCTTASTDTPRSIRPRAIASRAGQSTGPSAVGTGASMPVSAPASSSLITMLSRYGRQGRATSAMRSGPRLTSSRLVCSPAACARCSRADQPLPPSGRRRSMTGWMPGAPACKIRAPESAGRPPRRRTAR